MKNWENKRLKWTNKEKKVVMKKLKNEYYNQRETEVNDKQW
jgi:hypothetical protein